MKVKLLKKLRNDFGIVYLPSTGEYEVIYPKYFESRRNPKTYCIDSARELRREFILIEGRSEYSKYSKRLAIE